MDKKPLRSRPAREGLVEEIRRILETGYVSFKDHERRQSEERDIPQTKVMQAIESGEIIRGPEWNEDFGNWAVTMRGSTRDGETVTVALAVDLEEEWLHLLTAY